MKTMQQIRQHKRHEIADIKKKAWEMQLRVVRWLFDKKVEDKLYKYFPELNRSVQYIENGKEQALYSYKGCKIIERLE